MSKRKKHTFTLSEAAKKKLVLNLPYCMIGLYATKLGQAWRMAEGTNLSEKLLHLGDGFASAFASSLPSFHPADLLVGLLAGLLLRLAVYLKGKDAKKFRKGREYGSARWGTRKDIEPFIDPVFKNNILLTQTERLTMNSRPKDPRTARNKNVLVIGGSGSGKTRYLLKPNLMQCHSSHVITDPKGSLLIECGHLLEKKKYQIRFFNTINFKKSLHYNPFHYIHSEKDILKLANVLITNTDGGQKSGDPFWRNAEMLLYCALMGYIFYEAPPHEQNFNTLVAMINAMEVREDDDNFKNPVDLLFDALEEKDPDHFAVRQYHKYKLAAGKTAKSILVSAGARLAPFDIAELREILSYDELELDMLGDRKTALFLIMSDTDSTFNFLISIYVSLFGELSISTSKGVLKEADFSSPRISRLISYLLISRKNAISPQEITQTLWPDDSDNPAKNVKGLVYRLRQKFSLISDEPLILSSASGYQLNPKLHIMTDYQRFDELVSSAVRASSVINKVDILKNALDLYHGKVLSSADGEHWLIQFSTKYHLSYMGAVSELLKQLDSLHSYDLLNQYAMKSLTIAPDNPKAYCWLIRSLKAQGMNELATNELAAAKEHLTTEEYEEILAFGANW